MMSKITSYLKQHNLYFKTDLMEGIPRITMFFKNCDRCPDYITEGCIWFYEDSMEVRVYYSKLGAEICQLTVLFGGLEWKRILLMSLFHRKIQELICIAFTTNFRFGESYYSCKPHYDFI